jgi:hypothetical protein
VLAAAGLCRVLDVAAGADATVVLENLQLDGGWAAAAVGVAGGGGGLRIAGGAALRMTNCAVLSGQAHFGGGVYADGEMDLDRCTFAYCAANCGGGLYYVAGVRVEINLIFTLENQLLNMIRNLV